jgi:hypothetical protein
MKAFRGPTPSPSGWLARRRAVAVDYADVGFSSTPSRKGGTAEAGGCSGYGERG